MAAPIKFFGTTEPSEEHHTLRISSATGIQSSIPIVFSQFFFLIFTFLDAE